MGKFLSSLLILILIAAISVLSHFYSATGPNLDSATFFGPWNLLTGSLSGSPDFIETVSSMTVQRIGIWQDPALAVLIAFNFLFVLWMLRKA